MGKLIALSDGINKVQQNGLTVAINIAKSCGCDIKFYNSNTQKLSGLAGRLYPRPIIRGDEVGKHKMHIASNLSDDDKRLAIMELLHSYYCNKVKYGVYQASLPLYDVSFDDLRGVKKQLAVCLFEVARQYKYSLEVAHDTI